MNGLLFAILVSVGQPPAPLQPPRDSRPPAIVQANRERELRAAIAAHSATRETYFELADLQKRQGRFDDSIATLWDVAALEPASPQPLHTIGTFYWERVSRDPSLTPALKARYVAEGIRAEDLALALKADYPEAATYKSLLQRLQASASPPDASAGGFETFEQTLARLRPVRVAGNITAPTKIRDVKPQYPAEAQASRVQGVVIIEAVIGEDGKIANARVLRQVPLLDAAALDAVRQWEYAPSTLDGQPVAVVFTVVVNFTIQ
jgi:TonB family protein